jgi:hypothetical protein
MHRRVVASTAKHTKNGSCVGVAVEEGYNTSNGVEISTGNGQSGIASCTSLATQPPDQQQQQQAQSRRRKRKPTSSPFNPFSSMRHAKQEDRELAQLILGTCFVLLLVVISLVALIYYKHVRQPYMSWWSFLVMAFTELSKLLLPIFHFSPRAPTPKSGSMAAMKPSRIYTIPNSMANIGDKSDEYAKLRKEFDAKLPLETPVRSLQAVQALQWKPKDISNGDGEGVPQKDLPSPPAYDIYDCPFNPPLGYPHDWNTLELLDYWPPDIVVPPNNPTHLDAYQGICVFDYYNHYTTILNYRKAELPYVVRGDPQVAQAVERWNIPGFLSRLLSDDHVHRAEFSTTNHFLYWLAPRNQYPHKSNRKVPDIAIPKGWGEPTKLERMTYREWRTKAEATNAALAAHSDPKAYYYFRLIGCGATGPLGQCDPDVATSEWLFDELEFFQPRDNSLYLVNATLQRGIHCRFGSSSIIAENHFDGSRNSIVVLGGARRYILSHPDQCEKVALFPHDHPSSRHSSIEWDATTYRDHQAQAEQDGDRFHPEFQHARSNQVVLQPGDVLYLPTHWFHFIVSLSPITMQCNTRSGKSAEYLPHVEKCGF